MISPDRRGLRENIDFLMACCSVEAANASLFSSHVIALLATEMHFRRATDRFLEMVSWPVLYCFSRQRLMRLSVGTSQIQIRYWLALGLLKSARPTLQNFLVVLNPRANFLVCNAYLEKRVGYLSPVTVLRAYTGLVTVYHLRVYVRALEIAQVAMCFREGKECLS